MAMLVLGIVMLPFLAMCATYDLQTDWSNTNNPNGQWTYWQGSTQLLHQPAVSGGPLPNTDFFAPGPSFGGFLPAFWNGGDAIITHSVDSYNGNASLGESTLTWTSPSAGIVSISGAIWFAQSGTGRSNDFSLSLGSSPLISGTVSDSGQGYAYDKAHAVTFSFSNLTVSTGEVLSLVNERSLGYAPGTESAINLTVTETPVPLPASLLLFGPGLVGLAAIRRRFKK